MAGMMIAGMMGVVLFMVTRGIAESLITKDMTGTEQFLFSAILPILVSVGTVFITIWMFSRSDEGATDENIMMRTKEEKEEEQSSLWSIREDVSSYPRATFRGRVIESSYQKGDTIMISPSVLKEEKIFSVVDKEKTIEKRGALTIRK
jgi:hypothetical protein